jgi:peptidyl-tRNA hydrolase
VLSKFAKNERSDLEEIIQKCVSAAETFVNEGIDSTMNKFNS